VAPAREARGPGCYNARVRTARRYVISGRVQGVGFRMFAVDAGRRENLAGYVRNLDDGRVEVEAEGDADALTRFEAALWRGPSRARIDDIAIDDVPAAGRGGPFLVR
jgi:acylphosphatase